MKLFYSTILLMVAVLPFFSQKTLTLDDAVLGYYKGLYPKSMNGLKWVKNTNKFVYQTQNEIAIFNIKNVKIHDVKLNDLQSVLPDLQHLPYAFDCDKNNLSFWHNGSYIVYDYVAKTLSHKIDLPEKAEHQTVFNSNKIAFTKGNNVYIQTGDKTQAITSFDDKNIVSGQAIARFEFGIKKGIFFSPKGSKLAFYQKDETDVANYPLLDITQTPGQLKEIKYPMAGQKSERPKIGIYNIETKKTQYLKTTNDEHYLTNLTWSRDEKYVFVAELNREQNHLKWNKYDASNGAFVSTLFEEKNDKWVEPEHPLCFLPNKSGEFLWMSERDGFQNIYHYDINGKLIGQITKFKWVVTGILGFTKRNEVVLTGTGKDQRENHTFKVHLKTKKVTPLTRKKGVHNTQWNGYNQSLIDQYSSKNVPYVAQILGRRKHILKTSNNPLKDYEIGKTDLLTLKNGKYDLYGRIIKPANFDSTKRYPVLIYVYGGPHAQLVTNNWLGGASLWMYWMANQGYIVFTLDGRGSANRGFEFESGIHRQLGTLEIEDQKVGVNYLKSLPYVNADRMAVHGWSFGGFMTTSLLVKTDIFKVGVAGGPVIDWKWYEAMYGERYMDTPKENPKGYEKSGLLNKAKDLKAKLLLIHGTVDDVVVMQHNLAFVQKCIQQQKQIDFFPYPMHKHNVYGMDRVHLMRKILNYILINNK